MSLVVAVLALAYGTAAPNLSVAEFAPSAVNRPEAPPTTTDTGSIGQGSSRSRATTTTTTAPQVGASTATSALPTATTRVTRARTCFGTPPRQTEDPLAPPCVATIFDGDNGGSTSSGVSSTEIRVAVLFGSGRSSSFGYGPATQAFFDYFNSRFELYGRRLVPVAVEGSAADALGARTLASDVVSRNVFGAMQADQDWLTANTALPHTLAHGGVVTVLENLGNWEADRTLFDERHPYVWSIYPSLEDIETNLADFACTSLAGRSASHAGNAALRDDPRRFAILSIGDTLAPTSRILRDALNTCTGEAPLVGEWSTAAGSAALRTLMTQLQSAGATTVFCLCEGVNGYNNFPAAAQASGFAPEWIVTPSTWGGNNDDERILQQVRSGGLPPPIRVTAGPKLLPTQARPWFQVLTSADSKLTDMNGGSYSGAWALAGYFYDQLLVLASGIQAAGPNLTPETFAAGLMNTGFPNPGAGQAPYWQPSAGFGPGDHSFFDDYAISWWSDTAESLNFPVTPGRYGSWCYVDQGARFKPGTYPANTDDLLFNPNVPCR